MEVIKLENVIQEEIDKGHLDAVNLKAQDLTDTDRQFAWQSKISGSKIKSILSTPLSVLAYYMGWITVEDLESKIRSIPRMNYYRDYGSVMEPWIVDSFNTAIKNEFSDDPQKTILRDTLIDTSAVHRVRQAFAPNMRDKSYIKQDKRSFFLDIPNEPESNIFMINIDGHVTNPDGSVKSIIEIKTKTGAPGEGFALQDYYKMHMDQISFYWKMMQPTDGAYLLIDHHARGLKVHKFENIDLDNHWKTIEYELYLFAALYIQLLRLQNGDATDKQTAFDLLDLVESRDPEEECVNKKNIIEMINRI